MSEVLPAEADVVVVGAGLAGLRCARELETGGLTVLVLDAADEVGGRVRTDRVDGFLVDRGFQLLNPSYPEARRCLDLDALALGAFDAGVAARTERGTVRLGHPWHAPALLPATLAGVARQPGDLVALVRWLRPLAGRLDRPLVPRLRRRPDTSLDDALGAVGARGELRRVLEAFLAGVVLDDSGETSSHFADLLVASFVRATPGLPAGGMQAMPRQLAAALSTPVRTGVTVEQLARRADGSRVVVTDHGDVRARSVVVATDLDRAADLVPLPRRPTRQVVTEWYATSEPPAAADRRRLLHVDARARPSGPLVNVGVVSAAQPAYAPPGRHLVAASALANREIPDSDDVRRHAGELLGSDPGPWELVARHHVRGALPAQPPPLQVDADVEVEPGLLVCGDHRDTASIQGALVSGRRAARSVLAARSAT